MIPGLGRSPGEGKGYPLQYSGLENFMGCVKSMGLQRVRHESERPSLSLSKESMEEEDIMFTNIHVPNIETHEYGFDSTISDN